MADLTKDADLRILGKAYTQRYYVETTAAHTYYRGQPFIVDQTVDATGPLVPFIDALEVAADDVFMGICVEGGSVLIAAAETQRVELYVGPTIVGFKSAVFTNGADNGSPCRMSDSATLSATEGDNPQLGLIWGVFDGYCWVRLNTPFVCTGA